jgi:GntR family transcriptional regulator, transcriptional repressor for pyruvate dehydrogenase complex
VSAPLGGRADVARRGGKAYEEVAAHLRDEIVLGRRADGERLPNEKTLAEEYGVSRATIREALRVLSAQDLIRTAKGAAGGSYVQVPSVGHILEFLHSSINVLSTAQYVSVEELLEARELLEVPAARLAARRREALDVERLQAATRRARPTTDPNELFAQNADFHAVVLSICGNTLLSIAAQPVFTVLMSGIDRSALGARFYRNIQQQHRDIADAIAHGDAELAGTLMHEHLEYLRPAYTKVWERQRG